VSEARLLPWKPGFSSMIAGPIEKPGFEKKPAFAVI
jgi:hypothetical protein